MLPVRPEIECEVVPVPFTVVELVTLDWLSRMTEPAPPPDDVLEETVLPSREMIVLEVPFDMTVWAIALAHKASAAANVTRCFMSVLQCPWAIEIRKHCSGQLEPPA